jgi:rfaE bifunctional protein kinase chain/domain
MTKITVFVSGHFNVIHPGHLRLLKFAKERGDYLIVGVESDMVAGKKAFVNEKDRVQGVKSISLVDKVILIKSSIQSIIKKLKPNIIVKGKEFEGKNNLEKNIAALYGGSLIFSSGEKLFTSKDLINKEISEDIRTLHQPNDFLKRHNISKNIIQTILKKITDLKICVIGDLIVDEYINCHPLGMSQEDSVLVFNQINKKKFLGGAGIVAAHAASLGAKTLLISVAGKDENLKFACDELKKNGVNNKIFIDNTRPTTLKQKFKNRDASILRISNLNQDNISQSLQIKAINFLKKRIHQFDLIIFSDFNYGFCTNYIIEQVVKLAKKHSIFIAADSQSSSQLGDISRYKNVDLITPTEREARISTRCKDEGLVILSDKLREKSNAKEIILKLGEDGIFIHTCNEKGVWKDDRIKALNDLAVDISGAGDSLLVASSMSLALRFNIWEAAYLGSLAAGIQVSKIGNNPLTIQDFQNQLI